MCVTTLSGQPFNGQGTVCSLQYLLQWAQQPGVGTGVAILFALVGAVLVASYLSPKL